MEAGGPIATLHRWSLPVVAVLSLSYFLSYPFQIGRADESHLLFEARRILDGQVIYKDFFETLTPLSFYLFAGIFWIAGTSMLAARVSIAFVEAAGCALLFHLVRRIVGVTEAAIVTAIFAGICVPTWPHASPHWISTTLGLLVAATMLAPRWRDSMRLRPLVVGMLVGTAICVQQQRGVFVALWAPLALFVLHFSPHGSTGWRKLAAAVGWCTGGAMLVVLAVLGHAAWRASPAILFDMLVGFSLKHYGPTYAGRYPWAAVLPMTWQYRGAAWIWLLRAAPLFVLGEGIALAWCWRTWERKERELAALTLLALLMVLSVSYLPDFIHVSFVLPFLLIPGGSLLHRLRAAPVWSRVPAARHALTLGVSLIFVAVLGQGVRNVAAARSSASVRLDTAFGTIRVSAEMEQLYEGVRRHLSPESDGRNIIYSYPNDAWLYLALPADNATPFSLLAPDMFSAEYFEEASEILRQRQPGTVVVLPPFLSVSEATADVGRAIEEGYQLVEEVGAFRIYVRNPSQTASHVE